MPVLIERFADEPVVVVTFEGLPDQQNISGVNRQLEDLIKQMGMCYLILDLRGCTMTFGEAAALLNTRSISIFNDPVRAFFVGQPVPDDPTGSSSIPVFSNKEIALTYVREKIATGVSGKFRY